jgi:hypothetical protein
VTPPRPHSSVIAGGDFPHRLPTSFDARYGRSVCRTVSPPRS